MRARNPEPLALENGGYTDDLSDQTRYAHFASSVKIFQQEVNKAVGNAHLLEELNGSRSITLRILFNPSSIPLTQRDQQSSLVEMAGISRQRQSKSSSGLVLPTVSPVSSLGRMVFYPPPLRPISSASTRPQVVSS